MSRLKLLDLYEDLDLPSTQLLITDEDTGAGYIATISDVDEYDDNVVVRWGSYREGIRILEAYNEADSMPNV